MRRGHDRGFSLVELVVTVGIMAFAIVSMMQLYIYTSIQTELARHQTAAIIEAQNKIEEIRNYTYDNIVTDYSLGGSLGNTFNLTLLDGKGVIYIDNSNTELLVLEAVVSWEDKLNRIVGEDLDLDGVLDAGEDINGNAKIDSPARVMSMVTRR